MLSYVAKELQLVLDFINVEWQCVN
jgi:hypothetical protein